MMRWSYPNDRYAIGLMAMASSMTTGRFSTFPIPRMATCGWLMIGRYVSFAQARSYSAFFSSRTWATRQKLISKTEWTCADVRRLSTMCSAIFLRMTDIGTTLPGTGPPAGFVEGAAERDGALT